MSFIITFYFSDCLKERIRMHQSLILKLERYTEHYLRLVSHSPQSLSHLLLKYDQILSTTFITNFKIHMMFTWG
jgi:hypothetical protein